MTKKRALGRGLSALLNDDKINSNQESQTKKIVGSIIEVPLNLIITNPYQPRTQFDTDALAELAQSIKELGVIQPITVRKEGDQFQLISGERRFRASQIAKLQTIPAYIRLANDQEMLEMALVENIQRQDLDAIEIAISYQRMMDEISLTQDEMSKRVGKKRSTITNYLRLLKLAPSIQNAIRANEISMGHGRALINIEDKDLQLSIFERIKKNNLSVRQTEELVRIQKGEGKIDAPKTFTILPNTHKKALSDFSSFFDTTVEIKRNANGKGKIMINFKNDEEFIRIKNLLNS